MTMHPCLGFTWNEKRKLFSSTHSNQSDKLKSAMLQNWNKLYGFQSWKLFDNTSLMLLADVDPREVHFI